MNTQEIQEVLNHLIIGITALYTIVILVDFVVGIVHLWQKFTQVSHILHSCMVAAAQKFLSPIPVVIDIKISNSW